MFKRTKYLAGIVLACAVALPAAAQDVSADTVVASVNGTDITIGHMIIMRDSLPEQYRGLPDDVLFEAILNQAIQQTVLAQTVEGVSRSIELKLENERRAFLAGDAIERIVEEALTDEAIQAAYDEKYANAEPTKEYNASHILVETEDEAKALIAELEGGADFADLAKEKSTGPSGANGGSLGWFGAGVMVPAFETAVLEMKEGEISVPVQTQFGWHVIKLNETRLKGAPELAEVRAELIDDIQKKVVEETLTKLTDEADVVRSDTSGIGPEVLRDFSLLDE